MGSVKIPVNIGAFLVASPLLFASIFIPLRAEAGFFSFVSNMFSTPAVSADVPVSNSQNMALLQATLSPSTDIASSTGAVTIISGTSLSPETVPTGDGKDHNIDEDQISLYVVHQGDTLPAIAKMFGVTTNTIRWANDLKGNILSVGQTLVILPISGVKHIVKSGDTVQSIAKIHKGDLDEILQYNNLTKTSKLAVGDVVIVPSGEAVSVETPKPSKNNSGVGKTSPAYPVYEGYYMRPIIGGLKTQGLHGHNGIDLASVYGANILAAADGDVIISRSSGWNGGYGSYVVLNHPNGTQTLYAHLSGTEVNVGDHVSQGQLIGHMGSSGESTGTHLHFEIRGARNPF
jgi:LysM repeat protein